MPDPTGLYRDIRAIAEPTRSHHDQRLSDRRRHEEKRRRCRSFTAAFITAVVELRQRGDRSAGQVTKASDLTENTVRERSELAERQRGLGGLTSEERRKERSLLNAYGQMFTVQVRMK